MDRSRSKHAKNSALPLTFPIDAIGRDIVVAFSGGRDSVALLHALAQHDDARDRVRAVHIHHGLSPNADAWAEFVTRFCADRAIELAIVGVYVQTGARVSVEAAARTARYAALKAACRKDEIVALAHHRDDQIETFFLQLLRGAGARGLSGMASISPAAPQRPPLWRPLLDITRNEIDAYVTAHALPSIEDDSNRNRRFKRNALRLDVLPHIEKHFPNYRSAIVRAIAHQQSALAQLNADTSAADTCAPLPLTLLKNAPAAHAAELLRRWLIANTLPLPPAIRTREAVRQLQALSTDQRFRLQLGEGIALGVTRGHLHVVPIDPRQNTSIPAAQK